MFCKKRISGLIALLIAVIMAAAVFSACKLDGGNQDTEATETPVPTVDPSELVGTKVVMSSKHFDITLYDFGQAYYNSQYYMYYLYGFLTPDQFCDAVIDEVSSLLYILNAAVDDGYSLTDEENAEAESFIAEELEELLDRYEEEVPADAADRRAQAKANLEAALAEDGIDFDSFIELATNNYKMSMLANKYYLAIKDSIEITDEEMADYIMEHRQSDAKATVSDFVANVSSYNEGDGAYPTYIAADCFSVNHIAIMLETETDDEGNMVYIEDSRAADEFEIEQRLDEIEGFDDFMALEEEFGEDPGMDNELFRESGYIIHPDLIDDYYDGFVYAAMNLHEGSWKPADDPDSDTHHSTPALEFFKLKDGTMVVKVRTEPAIHYLIVNKEYSRGAVNAEKGDPIWESWKEDLAAGKLDGVYEELSEGWKEKYEIAVDQVSIKAKYSVVDDPDENNK